MNPTRERAKEHLPTVLLTLTSIVQALALELLWAKVLESGTLLLWSPGSMTVWLQAVASFFGIVLVWVLYANNIMRLRWVPDTIDSIAPFVVGILQFCLISWIGPSKVGLWLMAMAANFAVMSTVMQRTLRKAREDGDNAHFFEGRSPATWRDFVGVMVAVLTMLVAGVALEVSGYRGIGVPLLVAGCWLLLVVQLVSAHRFWARSIAISGDG